MKNILSLSLLVALEIFFSKISCAQNTFPSMGSVGIGTTAPNANSMLEVKSTTKGVLIPRMTKSERDAIASPPQGLLVYVTDKKPGFYYYESGWTAVKGGANTSLSNLKFPTAVNEDLLPDSDNARDLGANYLHWKSLFTSADAQINGITIGKGPGVSDFNTAIGYGTLPENSTGIDNTACGYLGLRNNTSGSNNTVCGFESLGNNTTGNNNTASGAGALQGNVLGNDNTASGFYALYSTNGSNNTGTGSQALHDNYTGSSNTADGFVVLYNNDNGNSNTGSGYGALYSNTSASFNTASGFESLYSNTSGNNNTAVGYQALFLNTNGTNNTAIGYLANVNGGGYSNSTALGNAATITASNQVRVGNGSVTSIGGFASWSNISDGRVKKNIRQDVPGLEFINKLKPITYNLDLDAADKIVQRPEIRDKDAHLSARAGTDGNDQVGQGKVLSVTTQEDLEARAGKEKIVYSGFIAQDVEQAAKEVGYDFSGVDAPKNDHDMYGLRYAEFVVPLVKAVQELDEENGKLKMENGELNSKVESSNAKLNDQQKQIDELKASVAQLQSSIDSSVRTSPAVLRDLEGAALLGQNIPNPFDNSTLIPFRIPKDCKDASIMITNTSSSEVISVIPVSCNEDHISIDAGTLTSGMYSYTLYVDGKITATKEMVITK